ncbi:MAG TPA: sulfite exporter TauE/SafE family protein [Acidimicrobiales bacterium]|nr:sulfite exporter TauE/SafE family protein [Acidimicrobiales bacterium]
MDPGPLRDAFTVVAGVGTGVLSAAFGVGGAVISTPAIRLLGASASAAVGTTLPSILPSAATGALRYSREGLVDGRIVTWTTPAGVVASVGGSLLSHVIPGDGHWLMVLTAVLLGFTAWRMARQPEAPPAAEADVEMAPHHVAVALRPDRPAVLVAIGAAAGLLSGLLGVGGGVVMVPAFTEIAGIPLKTAIASSLACVGLFAIPGTVTHALIGGVDWRFALCLGVGVIPGARLGAHLAIRAGDTRLRRAVALFLGVIAVIYAAGEIAALF